MIKVHSKIAVSISISARAFIWFLTGSAAVANLESFQYLRVVGGESGGIR